MYIDTHTHIRDHNYTVEEQEAIIKSLKDSGVSFIIDIGTAIETSLESIELAKAHKTVYATVGIHPYEIVEGRRETYDIDENIAKLDDIIKKEKKHIVAMGEIGLDYHYQDYSRTTQIELFIKQLELAKKHALPLVIHLRSVEDNRKESNIAVNPNENNEDNAFADFLEIVRTRRELFDTKILMHCYAGSLEYTKEVVKELNPYFSFGGIITFKKARDSKAEIIKEIGLNRIMAETDCPYLTPEPMRGKFKNEPKYVSYVYKRIAEIFELDEEVVKTKILENINDMFKLDGKHE
ncbi:MAG: TatD family hydrolase [Firmicutes bacterium]|nr:TatD family hydrolase [Bacillota bacterium]